jgi:hypothetical protein
MVIVAGRGVAGLPQLGEGELQQREAALGAGGDELLDHRLGVEADVLEAAGPTIASRTPARESGVEEVDRGVDVEADVPGRAATRVRKSPRTVASRRRPGTPRATSARMSADRGQLGAVGEGDELLELVDEDDEALVFALASGDEAEELGGFGRREVAQGLFLDSRGSRRARRRGSAAVAARA